MKKVIIICLSVLSLGIDVFSQEKQTTSDRSHDNNNELRFNIPTAIAGLPEINYERIINDNMGVGLALAASLEKPVDMNLRALAIPYCRVYFSEKKMASGFFIEGNMAVAREKEVNYYYDGMYNNSYDIITSTQKTSSTTSVGFGAAIGFKLLTRNNVVGEVYLGGGRLFGDTFAEGYPRIGICIGKRF